MSPSDPFMQAISSYQANNFDEAVAHCRALLQTKPDHAACLHLLGVIVFMQGDSAEAERLMRKSVILKPGFAEIHYSFAKVLTACGKHGEALDQYRRTIAIKPTYAEAYFSLANALEIMGQAAEAEQAYAKAIAAKPDFPEALNNLGVYHFERREFDAAKKLQRRALDLRPDYAAALANLGNIYKEQGKWAEAIDHYRLALALKPDLFPALNNLGLALMYGEKDVAAAEACFEQILTCQPDNIGALTHLGVAHCMQGDFAEGLVCYDKALARQPDYYDAINNRGNALKALGRLPEAISCFDRVLEQAPDDAEIHNNRAMALLAAERFEEGWQEYEWRWKTTHLAAAKRNFSQQQWRGEEGRGRTLLIHAEQGFGDTLQFCRYAPLAAKHGWRVIVQAQPELVALLRSLQGVEKIIGMNDALPDFDMHCPMLSLPEAFATRVETIPTDIPYLFADPDKIDSWRARLQGDKGYLKIGLTWTGNPRLFSLDLSATNKRRSLPPDALTPLAGLTNARFYSLQKDGYALKPDLGVIDFMPECHDFADTAALIAALDLVISVDTATAHLAAALGKPVWLLNRYDTCWRWFPDREDSPWYPTLRIFRQPRPEDWRSVIERVCNELATSYLSGAP